MKPFLTFVLGLALATGAQADHAFDLLKQPGFRKAWLTALGPLKSEKWMAQLPGPSTDNAAEKIGGIDYVLADSCKPHDCGEENLVLAFEPAKGLAYAIVLTRGQKKLYGNPPAAVAAALEKAYAARFKPQ